MKLTDEDVQRIAEAVAQKLEKPPATIPPPVIYITNPAPNYTPGVNWNASRTPHSPHASWRPCWVEPKR